MRVLLTKYFVHEIGVRVPRSAGELEHRSRTTVVSPGSWSSPFYSKFTKKGVSRYVDTGGACRRAGTRDFRIHDLRHTCAAWRVSAEVPLTAVRDLLGHTTVKMTERYAHLAPENIRAAVLVLEGGYVTIWSRCGLEGIEYSLVTY